MHSPRTRSIEKRPCRILLLTPNSVPCDLQQTCAIVLSSPLPEQNDVYIKFSCSFKKTFVRGEKISPNALSFVTPGNFPVGNADIAIHYGPTQSLLCTYHKPFVFNSKIEIVQQLLDTASEPLSFIASAYNMSETDSVAIDFKLEHALKTNIPSNFNLLKEKRDHTESTVFSSLRIPTLLHFAARYNLVRLCVTLLDMPGSNEALNITNVDGLVPSQLAELYGNNHLSQILSDAQHTEKYSDVQSNMADEVYEQMSGEIYDRYIEVKNLDIYQDISEADNELYEEMYSSRRESSNSRSNIPFDKQSVYSSDSAVSSASNDSRGSVYASNDQCAPPVPPPDCRRSNKPVMNPLLSELKRKTEEKRNVFKETSEVYDFPPRSSQSNLVMPSADLGDIYDVPPDSKNKNLSQEICDFQGKHESETSNVDEVYDTPPIHSSPDEIYDSPPKQLASGEIYDSPPKQFVSDKVYDIPPKQLTYDEVYDTPPKQLTSDEVYDTPPKHFASDEVYDTPPKSFSTDDVYDTPLNNFPAAEVYETPPSFLDKKYTSKQNKTELSSTKEVYDIPPRKRLPSVPSPRVERDDVYDFPPTSNSCQDDEIYDDVLPLKPRHHTSNQDLSPMSRHKEFQEARRNAKRLSEPALSLSASEHQRLGRLHAPGKPLLPPRNPVPARNGKPGRSLAPPLPQRR
ncbi:phosphoinositide 3-kinase adapter protein 1-like [Hydractinia symbiolongicarpus]|uniref:phosphoinositide 3-kinase adapter protein 1-like n=1 Tax=Hydractinia symbiolongicarpus TaxID=13093 RepID=UPI00254D0AC8|nr:phosphoinositide 3-kinase adapter protein 1-like [Hydractinia symbiolongicarpus]